MSALLQAQDWSSSPLGPPQTWPQSLRSALSICLGSGFPIAIYWGKALALLYNDAWSPIPGAKHPWALGRPGREVWPEIWDTIGPLFEQVMTTGAATRSKDQLLPMRRHGYTEECYFDYTFSPIRAEDGSVGGIFNAVVETTFRVISERRTRLLQTLGERVPTARSAEEACTLAAEVLDSDPADMPFCLLYLADDEGRARLTGAAGLAPGLKLSPGLVDPADPSAPWKLAAVLAGGAAEMAEGLAERLGPTLPDAPWPEPVERAIVVPIAGVGASRPAGALIAGISPRLALDDEYRAFIGRVAGQVATAVANARAYQEERRRAEALAEIDRAKTTFFSNVSHEFRTPLTLLLGPLEDALHDRSAAALPAAQRERLDVAHRNGLRLLRLVNTLLDFSRIEAGRVQASYRPTDLAALTADLASGFRSAVDRAGLSLRIDCRKLPAPVFVDRDMWEKIVLNLLSNAFKFTFAGGITVSLRAEGESAVLGVRDTGVGIPEHELPRVFERFHRIEGQRSRSFEGSGIGLALVNELVRLHGGAIGVQSEPGKGSEFTVTIPFGTAHLQADRIGATQNQVSTATRVESFVEEALRWLPDMGAGDIGTAAPAPPPGPSEAPGGPRPRVLLADDNADMRDYVRRLLGDRYDVTAAADGQEALEAVRRARPDLVLSDVMMPRLDGFGLLRAIREDPGLRDLSVILLSARAGDEARAEGLDAGADDYLTKPFSARELLARVGANLAMVRLRREAAEALRARTTELETVLETVPVAVWFTSDPEAQRIHGNRMAARLLRMQEDANPSFTAPEAERPGHFRVFRNGVALAPAQLPLQRAARGEVVAAEEEEVRFADGTSAVILIQALPIRDPAGGIAGAICAATDITERKRAEALRTAQNRVLELAIQDTSLGEALDGLVRAVEAQSPSGMLGSILLLDEGGVHLRHGAAPSLPDAYNRAIDGVAIGPAVGSCGTAAYRKAPVYVSDIAADPLCADFRDLALSHGLRACWSTPILSGQGRVLAIFALYYREPRAPTPADLELVDVVARSASLVIEHKRAEAALHRLNETLEQRVSDALAERKLWADIFESTDASICVLGTGFRFLAANKAYRDEFARIYGVRPRVGDDLLALLAGRPGHQAAARAIWARALGGEEFTTVEEFGDENRARPCYEISYNTLRDARGRIMGAFQYARDVTERLRSQAQLAAAEAALRQAQKMEAVGQLTGGIAHDFNNLLTGIAGSLELMQARVAQGRTAELGRYITAAMTSVTRASALTHRLLAFARRQALDPRPTKVNKLVAGMEELIRRTVGPGIEVETVLAAGLWPTLCDANQLENALLNLCINARDAMAQPSPKAVHPGSTREAGARHEGGRLTIETANAHLDEAYAASQGDVRPGQYVSLSVTDTGTGMSPDVIARAFEPFFTTKPLGQGTGLGLSMLYGFVKQSEGHVRIYSEPGQGTTVRLYLPRHHGDGAEADADAAPRSEVPRAEAGETVLVVEDEAVVRALIVEVLADLGYAALEAADGPAGLRILQSKARVDLLVTDVGLPGMNGRQLADAARERRPGLKVLFITGYAHNAAFGNGVLEPGMELIAKPFALDALAAKIRAMIEGRRRPPSPGRAER